MAGPISVANTIMTNDFVAITQYPAAQAATTALSFANARMSLPGAGSLHVTLEPPPSSLVVSRCPHQTNEIRIHEWKMLDRSVR
jgi:hypothetical protein